MALITYLVEDNQMILDNLVETLQEIAHVKVTAHSDTQVEAAKWLMSHDGHWHLAIVDLFLRQGNGLDVLAGCHNREPYQKVVLLSNHVSTEIRRQALAMGADRVFDKSCEVDELIAYCVEQRADRKCIDSLAADGTATN